MSTIQVINAKHPSSASNNLVLDNAGNATFAGTAAMASSFLRNRIINGDMRIDQRNAGASISVTATGFPVDRFYINANSFGVISGQRSTVAPAGFTNSVLMTVTTARSSIAASDVYGIRQTLEGFNTADFGWGAAGAQTVTLSFWVRSSIAGTYTVSLFNAAFNRSYVATYTVNSANTFEYKTVTVPGDITGTWATDNTASVNVFWDLGSGSNFQATANSWVASGSLRTSGSTNWISTNGATFYLTGVQLEVGSVATPFERRQFGQELALCQRYYETSGSGFASALWNGYALSGSIQYAPVMYKVTKRANPTITLTANASYNNLFPTTAGTATNITTENFYVSKVANGTGQGGYFSDTWTAAAEL